MSNAAALLGSPMAMGMGDMRDKIRQSLGSSVIAYGDTGSPNKGSKQSLKALESQFKAKQRFESPNP